MTTTIHLIRHAAHDLLGRVLTGRMAGVPLGAAGRLQARLLAERLAPEPLAAVCSGPLERARETAAPIAARHELAVDIVEDFDEMAFGEWTGRRFEDLSGDPVWQRFNALRSVTRAPGGELMTEVQSRMVAALFELERRHPDRTVAVIGHGDPIRSALAFVLGSPLDLLHRFEVEPASISTLALSPDGPRLLRIAQVVAP